MGSTPSDPSDGDGPPRGVAREGGAPEALTSERLDAVPGVLGRIARERAAAYAPSASASPRPSGRPARGSFAEALRSAGVAVIAEVKRASPSQGAIADVDPVATARAYVAGGAAAVSVLTEPNHFGGALSHLAAVSEAVRAPTLRKDFVVHPAQVLEARAHGASAVLLIVAVLGEALGDYLGYARALGLDAVVEVHDERELESAVRAGATLIGVNNRDLRTLSIDLATAPRLIALGRASGHEALWVAESGYDAAAAVAPLRGLADAVLIGTGLVRHDDPATAVRAFVAAGA
jgi:indole-3-glycerol phosphate synthase